MDQHWGSVVWFQKFVFFFSKISVTVAFNVHNMYSLHVFTMFLCYLLNLFVNSSRKYEGHVEAIH